MPSAAFPWAKLLGERGIIYYSGQKGAAMGTEANKGQDHRWQQISPHPSLYLSILLLTCLLSLSHHFLLGQTDPATLTPPTLGVQVEGKLPCVQWRVYF